jgi:hypothetical protein
MNMRCVTEDSTRYVLLLTQSMRQLNLVKVILIRKTKVVEKFYATHLGLLSQFNRTARLYTAIRGVVRLFEHAIYFRLLEKQLTVDRQ